MLSTAGESEAAEGRTGIAELPERWSAAVQHMAPFSGGHTAVRNGSVDTETIDSSCPGGGAGNY